MFENYGKDMSNFDSPMDILCNKRYHASFAKQEHELVDLEVINACIAKFGNWQFKRINLVKIKPLFALLVHQNYHGIFEKRTSASVAK